MPDTIPHQGVQKEMEGMPYSSESFRIRCPHCSKLYLVQFSDVQESKPRFECAKCRNRFWLSLPDMDTSGEVMGLPLQVREAPQTITKRGETEPCPKCFKPNAIQARECSHCGVMIGKFRAQALSFQETLPAHSPALRNAWKKVVDDYGNEKIHGDFIRLAQVERNLPYAAAQYAQMQKLMPNDEVTDKRIREIQALGTMMMPDEKKAIIRGPYARLWQIPLFGAVLLMATGLALPMFRNVVGLGAAFLFLALALRIQFGRRN